MGSPAYSSAAKSIRHSFELFNAEFEPLGIDRYFLQNTQPTMGIGASNVFQEVSASK